MPRYFITTSDHIAVLDEEGTDLPDIGSLRHLLREVLVEILRDEGARTGVNEFTAEACDEDGRRVMRARISFTITDQ